MEFSKDVLKIDAAKVADDLAGFICDKVRNYLKRKGAVIGLSGGIDSAVAGALCVKALGKERVHGLILPERDSNPVTASTASCRRSRSESRWTSSIAPGGTSRESAKLQSL